MTKDYEWMTNAVGLESVRTEVMKIQKQEVQERERERERPSSTHPHTKWRERNTARREAWQRGRLKGKWRVKSLPKRQTHTHKHTNETTVQGRREKKHRKTIITLHVCKNTSCDCVDQSTFSNDVTLKSKWNSQPTTVCMLHYCSVQT